MSDSTEATTDDTADGAGFVHPLTPIIPAEEIPKVKAALLRYRVMAYVVGTLLVLLFLVAMPLKYFGNDSRMVTYIGFVHGWLYMALIITAIDLGRRVKWSIRNVVGIALAGTIPFLSFVAEHIARKDVNRKLADSNPEVLR